MKGLHLWRHKFRYKTKLRSKQTKKGGVYRRENNKGSSLLGPLRKTRMLAGESLASFKVKSTDELVAMVRKK